ncbi:GIY-YIG nuclease family protein, partial [Membranihabitans maritimus]
MVYVYILFSEQFDKYYVGQSIDVDNRIYQHNFDDSNSFTS